MDSKAGESFSVMTTVYQNNTKTLAGQIPVLLYKYRDY